MNATMFFAALIFIESVTCCNVFSINESLPTLFPVITNKDAGFIDNSGKVVIPLTFSAVSSFSEGVAAVQKEHLWGYIDRSGSERISFRYSDAKPFVGGYAGVRVEKL